MVEPCDVGVNVSGGFLVKAGTAVCRRGGQGVPFGNAKPCPSGCGQHRHLLSPATHLSPSLQTIGCSTFNSAGARMCQASVTSSRNRVISMPSSRTITNSDQLYIKIVKNTSGSLSSSACFSASSPTYRTAMLVRITPPLTRNVLRV